MSAMLLRLIDAILDHHCQPDHNWNVARTLAKLVINSMAVDAHCRAEVMEEDIGDCLKILQGDSSNLQGEYLILKWWYRHGSGRQSHPSCTDLGKVLGYYEVMYHQ